MLATWGTAIVAYLVCFSIYVHQLIQQHLIHSRPPQPIFPVTAACMIALFFGILYIGRSLSQEARLASAFIGAIAALMIFEFPFDLIVMTRTYLAVAPDPALYQVLFFAPLFLVELTTLALLSLSPLVRLTRAAFFAFALMLLIFAAWALFGLGYPSAPLPFAFNAASKVVAFVVALSLFFPHWRAAQRSTRSSQSLNCGSAPNWRDGVPADSSILSTSWAGLTLPGRGKPWLMSTSSCGRGASRGARAGEEGS
jgi:hypothetical protein